MEMITYYALLLDGDTRENPSGMARRGTDADGGLSDEVLTADLTWSQTPLIAGWMRGDTTFDFIEISEADATQITQRLRQRWAGQP